MSSIVPRFLRWESPRQYFTARLQQDLLGDWILACAWGGRNSKTGNMASLPVMDQAQADAAIELVHNQRIRHRYRLVLDQTA